MTGRSTFAVELAKLVRESPEAMTLLSEALGNHQPREAHPLAYTVATLADATGLSPKAIRGAIKRRELPARRIGGERGPYLIPGKAARAWVWPDSNQHSRRMARDLPRRPARRDELMRIALAASEQEK